MGESRIITVGQSKIGLIGLDEAIEAMKEAFADRPDQAVAEEMLRRLEDRNYIPDRSREEYGRALVRAFHRALGRPSAPDSGAELEIKVLGMGCTQCDRLEQMVLDVLASTAREADVEHVRDVKEIGRYGVLGLPALVVNGRVMCVGRTPSRNELVKWLGGSPA